MSDVPSESAPVDAQAPPSNSSPRSPRKYIRKFFIRVWLPLVAVFVVYLYVSFRATGFDQRILTTDAKVAVIQSTDSISFTPTHDARPAALIFIPGAMVEPTAYAPLAHAVAEKGYAVVIPKLPMRFAPLESQRQAVVSHVQKIMESGAAGTRWVVAGHSLGGVLACRVARHHSGMLSGLVLIGTSHPRDFDLSNMKLDVTKITSSNDGLASPEEVRANAKKLPSRTHWVMIDGGNHSQFGYYGFQLGDHRATISRADQQAQTSQAILDALGRVGLAE